MLISAAVNCGLVICGGAYPKGGSLLGNRQFTCTAHGTCESYQKATFGFSSILGVFCFFFIFAYVNLWADVKGILR